MSTPQTPNQVSEGVSTTPINDTRIPTPLREENVTTTVTNSSNAVGDTSTNDGEDVDDAVINPRSSQSTRTVPSGHSTSPDSTADEPTGRTRSGRSFRSFHSIHEEKYETYLSYVIGLADHMDTHDAFLVESDLDSKSSIMTQQFHAYSIYQRLDADLDISTGIHPLAFAARANAEDTPRFHEAMKSQDREGFIQAMK